ncbi:MAG: hypothetical protein KAW51_06540 [Candidatus Lokiarchaeota archaeon]|nr:hypothetical protein [Candidatus Lokiarchaeota archaeon]
MVQIANKIEEGKIKVKVSYDLGEIREALEEKLFVPNIRVKDKVIDELLLYLKDRFSNPEYKFKPIISYTNGKISGIVICCINPHYTSYSRKCGTFGWLSADSFEICEIMMKECEKFVKENKIRKIRGPINFPKSLGGIGIQYTGFQEQMLYGVAFTDPESHILSYLESLRYQKESEYTCVYVAQKTWNKGKMVDKDIILRYLTLEELYNFIDDIENLAANSLYQIMPDSSGINRIHEFFEAYSKQPKSFYKIQPDFNPKNYSDIPQFIEAWESCDLEKIEAQPTAFDRNTGELVGIILTLPDLFEVWAGNPITRVNVDTAMVKKGYYGRGIFSALNNIGQITYSLRGAYYYEGTSIWSNNSRAIDTIFPHCRPVRKHYVVQKRI